MATPLRVVSLLLLPLLVGCTLHSTATHWHGRTGPDGQPVFVRTTTIYGVNLLLVLPLLGDPRTDNLVDAATAKLAEQGSDRVRVVETESANYWYAIPPLTWFVSPVVGSVSIEYTPSPKELAAARELDRLQEERAAARREQDHSQVFPELRR